MTDTAPRGYLLTCGTSLLGNLQALVSDRSVGAEEPVEALLAQVLSEVPSELLGAMRPRGFTSVPTLDGVLRDFPRLRGLASQVTADGNVASDIRALGAELESLGRRMCGEGSAGTPLRICRAFEGPGDDRPVTYPVAVDGRGTVLEGYKSFVENDARGLRSLPAIDDDDPSLSVVEQQQENPKQKAGGGQKKPDRPQGNRGGSDRGHRGVTGPKQGGSR